MSTISKTEFTFTVLHRSDMPFEGDDPLAEALEQSNDGHAVGSITNETTQTVDDGDVKHQLELLGNDGTFFDDDLAETYAGSLLEERNEAYAAIQRIQRAWEGGNLAGALNDAAGLIPDDFPDLD